MAQIQWNVMDPAAPAKIAGSFYEGQQEAAKNALAQKQLQREQSANELVKYQIGQARSEEEARNALSSAYKGAYNPQTGQLDQDALMQSLVASNAGYKIPEIQKQLTEQRAAQIKQATESVGLMKSLASNVVANPTLENATAALQRFSSATGSDQSAELARLQAIGENPQAIKQWAAGHAYSADQMLPKLQNIDLGGVQRMMMVDPLTGKVLSQQDFRRTMTPGESARLAQSERQFSATQQLEREKMGEKAQGVQQLAKSQVQAKQILPRIESSTEMALKNIDDLIKHPGFSQAVGAGIPGLKYVPGTSVADFNARLEQLLGGAFLEAFNELKGGGQITEVEGLKATAAITRMSTAQSEKEFVAAAKEFKEVLKTGLKNARKAAGVSTIPGGWSVEEH